MRCKYSINNPAIVWYSRFSSVAARTAQILQRHMAVCCREPSGVLRISWRASISRLHSADYGDSLHMTSLNVYAFQPGKFIYDQKAKWVLALPELLNAQAAAAMFPGGEASGWRRSAPTRLSGSPRNIIYNRSILTWTTPVNLPVHFHPSRPNAYAGSFSSRRSFHFRR